MVISVYKYHKDYASLLMEEENEESETEPSEYKDYSLTAFHEFSVLVFGQAGINYFSQDIRFISSYINKPETPPPNLC